MAAEVLSFIAQANISLVCAVVVVLASRGVIRAWFGARITYALWFIVPAALIAIVLPARTIETVAGLAASQSALVPTATEDAISKQTLPLPPIDLSSMLVGLWLAGIAAMLVVLALRQRAFVASLGRLKREADGTLRTEINCAGPVILGALRPKLVLPKDFEGQFNPIEQELILAHERVHLKRRDPLLNGLTALARCICWFNPLAHLAAHVMRIDQELACDAIVAARFPKSRRTYAEAMLKTQLMPMNLPVGCTWSMNGVHPLKIRIAMLKRDLPNPRRVAAGLSIAAALCLATGCSVWTAQPPREMKADVNSISQSAADVQLLRAVSWGNAKLARAALEAGADANTRSRGGLPALTIAARADDTRILELLLDHGADVNLVSSREGTALVAAGRRGQLRAVAVLVAHGAELNSIVPRYGTPLAAAVRTGQFDVVRYLVEHGAEVNRASPPPAPWDRWGVTRTPLQVAIDGNHVATAEYLKSMGAHI